MQQERIQLVYLSYKDLDAVQQDVTIGFQVLVHQEHLLTALQHNYPNHEHTVQLPNK